MKLSIELFCRVSTYNCDIVDRLGSQLHREVLRSVDPGCESDIKSCSSSYHLFESQLILWNPTAAEGSQLFGQEVGTMCLSTMREAPFPHYTGFACGSSLPVSVSPGLRSCLLSSFSFGANFIILW